MANNWYDEGEGSESLKRKIAKDALNNPVPHPICIGCKYKHRKKVAIIVTDLMGGDAIFQVVSEKDYKIIKEFHPTKSNGNFDGDKYQQMVADYLYIWNEEEEQVPSKKILKRWFTQTFVPEEIDLSKYDVVGMLTLPGG